MTTPSPTQRLASGHAASAATTAVPAQALTSTQEAYRQALRKAADRGDRLSSAQRMTLGYLTQQADAAQAVTA